ncbi:hypothetical protein EC991_008936 [Linnemannia zychae]|nr:hypothetical protein EC991_008936 [Linnemannia zychae]
MSKRQADETLENPSAQLAKVLDGGDQQDDRYVALVARLKVDLFGIAQPSTRSMLLSTLPICGNHRHRLQPLISAFAAAPQISDSSATSTNMSHSICPESMSDATYSSLQPRAASNRSKGNRASNRSSSNNSDSNNNSSSNSSSNNSSIHSRSSTISGGQLSPGTILKMQKLFRRNFDEFGGNGWKLPSGAILDNLLAVHVERLPYECSLHSFVIEDVKGVLQLATDGNDRALLKTTLVDRPKEQLPALSTPEKAFLKKYNLPPDDLRILLATSGWQTIGSSLKKKPDEEFQEVVHTCVLHLLTVYRQVGMAVPTDSTESWYTHVLWHFLGISMYCSRRLEYQPGEFHSNASGYRRNKVRTREGRQYTGHKADGMVITKLSRFELCAIEAAKKDSGPNGTKALDDTRKLAKMTKDMHDKVRDAATENIRDTLLTFGVRISALTMILYTMRQRPGRFYQLCTESSASLPDMCTEDNTMAVLGVLERVLVFRKAMIEMGRQIPQWTSVSVGGSNPGAHDDWQAATLTSPHLIPDIDYTTAETAPELTLP